jgi:hypothetical protein
MNKKLQEAEEALTNYLAKHPDGVSMRNIIKEFRFKIDESELRAAVWTLKSRGLADFSDGKLRPLQLA